MRHSSDDAVREMHKLVNREVCGLLVSKAKFDNLGGIAAIIELINVDNRALNTDLNLNMFGRYILNLFPPFGSDVDVICAGAGAIGALAGRGLGSLTQPFVSKCADTALEWLEHATARNELKRMGAALILAELTTAQPSLMFNYIQRVLAVIFTVIHDIKPAVREAGVRTLQACLLVWKNRR